MNIATLASAVGLIGTVGGGGVYLATNYATTEELQVVSTKAEYGLDKHQEYLLTQINRLESKKDKTPDDLEQLRYLRDELKRIREIRKGS